MFSLFFRRVLALVLIACGVLLPAAAPSLHAKPGNASDGTAIDVNFFSDALKDDGSWYNTTEYGDVWQPYIAYKSDTWRPYTDGYWSYTDGGWMFVSNENFGWAVYHYGRWTRLKDIGWAWVPGTDWAPAWVTWRASKPDGNGPPAGPDGSAPAPAAIDATSTAPSAASDDKNPPPPDRPPAPRSSARDDSAGDPPPSENYIGWAPLPPEPTAYTTVDYSYGPTVDVDFGIDPYDYCFTDVRTFGAPYVAAVIFDPGRSYYYADRSVNITNIYYNRNGGYRGFYAGGPDYNRFRGMTQRPIPQYNLRQTSGSAAQAAIRNKQFTRLNGDTLAVPAPQFSRANVGPDGRVKLTRSGALAKAQVNRAAPAAAADNPAYKQARESFARQGDAYRSQHPNAPGNRAAALTAAGLNHMTPEAAPKITTTPRAQQEERDARRAAGGDVPPPETRQKSRKELRREARKERAEHVAAVPGPRQDQENAGPKPEANRPETANAPAAAGEAHRSRKAARREAPRQAAASRAPEGVEPRATARQERRSEPVRRERPVTAPRVEQRSAPRPVAAAPQPKPAGGGGGGGEKKDDKKKK